MWTVERKPKLAINELVSLCPAEPVVESKRQVIGEVLSIIHDRSWMRVRNPPPPPKDRSLFAPALSDTKGHTLVPPPQSEKMRSSVKVEGSAFAQSSLSSLIHFREQAKQATVYRIGFPPSFDYVIETTAKPTIPSARLPKSPMRLLQTPLRMKKCGSSSRLRPKKHALGTLVSDSCTSPATDWLVSIKSDEPRTMAYMITPLSSGGTPLSMDGDHTAVKGLLTLTEDGAWTKPVLQHEMSDQPPKEEGQSKKPQSTKGASHVQCASQSISFAPSFMSPLSGVVSGHAASSSMVSTVTIDMSGKLGITMSAARLFASPPPATNQSYSLLPTASDAAVNTDELKQLRTNFKEFFHGEVWLSSSQVSCVCGYDVSVSAEHVTAERKLSRWLNDYCEKHKDHIHWAMDRSNDAYVRPFNVNGVIDFDQFLDILLDLLPLQRYFEFEQTSLETVVLVDRDSFGRLCSGTFEDVSVSADTFFSPHELSHVYSVIYSDEIPEQMEDPLYLPLYAIPSPNNIGQFINISEMFCDWNAQDFEAYFEARSAGVAGIEYSTTDTLECLLCELALDTLFAFSEDLGLHKTMPMKKLKSVGFDDCYHVIYAWLSHVGIVDDSKKLRNLFPLRLIDLCYDYV